MERRTYLTISPDERACTSRDDLIETWNKSINNLFKKCRSGIAVIELASGRPHYHLVLDVKDLYGYTKLLFKYRTFSNVKEHNKFKNGFHYLFKQVDYTKECLKRDVILLKE